MTTTRRSRRIGLICDTYPAGDPGGGIGTYVQLVGHHLSDLGYEVHVFHFSTVPSNGPLASATRDGPLYVHSCTGIPDRLELLKRLHEAIETVGRDHGPFDFIECPEYGAYGLAIERGRLVRNWGIRLHTSTKIARLASQSWPDSTVPRALLSTAVDALEAAACLRAPILTAPSQAIIRETARHWPIDVETVRRAANPVPLRPQTPRDQAVGGTVLFWGRLEYLKGVDLVADAFGSVRRSVPNVIFEFVGPDRRWPTGEWGSELVRRKQRAHGMNASAVRWHGPLDHTRLAQLVARCSVAVLPSRFENCPYSVLEAMSHGKPLVSCAVGGIPELVRHGSTGLLARSCDPDEIALHIIDALSDRDRSSRMGMAARTYIAERHDPSRIVPMLLEHWELD